jgi:hypothetical protein
MLDQSSPLGRGSELEAPSRDEFILRAERTLRFPLFSIVFVFVHRLPQISRTNP